MLLYCEQFNFVQDAKSFQQQVKSHPSGNYFTDVEFQDGKYVVFIYEDKQ